MRKHTNIAVAGMAGLAVVMGGIAGCSDGASEDAAGVDTLPSTPASSSPSESASGAEELTSLTDSFEDDHNGWVLPPSEFGTMKIEAGDLVWDDAKFEIRPHLLATTVGEAFDQGRLDLRNVRVTASVTPERGSAAVGVFCRDTPDTDADFQWYEFVVGDGYAAIRLSDSSGNLKPLAQSDGGTVADGTATTVEGRCVDGADGSVELSLYQDGAQLLTAQADDPLDGGAAGLQAYTASQDQADEPSLLAWHDFSVQQG
jgi:hypothetical protein